MFKKKHSLYGGKTLLFCCLFVFAATFAETTELNFEKGEFSADKVNEAVERKIRELADDGYPFARISPKIFENEDEIRVILSVEKGNRVEAASVRFVIGGRLRPHLVEIPTRRFAHGGDSLYRQEKVERIRDVLQSEQYIREVRSFAPEIGAEGNYEIPISVQAQNRAFFSGGLGFSNSGGGGGSNFVGNLQLDIINVMGFGESVDFSYVGEKYFYRISANLEIPYFFQTPLGLLFSADMEIGDSLYGATALSAGLKYSFKRFWAAKMLASYAELTRQDSVSRYGGVQITLANSPPPFRRSQRGSRFVFEVESGVIYEFREQMPKADFEARTAFHLPLRQTRLAYLAKPAAGAIAFKTPQNLHLTQLFRLGGAQSVRGYQENVFPCLAFAAIGNDLRFYIDDFSAVYLLADYAAASDKYSLKNTRHLFGYGLGISLPLRRFVFSLEWARNVKDISNFGRLHFTFSTY